MMAPPGQQVEQAPTKKPRTDDDWVGAESGDGISTLPRAMTNDEQPEERLELIERSRSLASICNIHRAPSTTGSTQRGCLHDSKSSECALAFEQWALHHAIFVERNVTVGSH